MVTQRHDRLSLGLNIEISYFIVAILNITFQSIIIIFYNFEFTARVNMLFFQASVPAKENNIMIKQSIGFLPVSTSKKI